MIMYKSKEYKICEVKVSVVLCGASYTAVYQQSSDWVND